MFKDSKGVGIISLGVAGILSVFIVLYVLLWSPPGNIKAPFLFTIDEGDTLGETGSRLKESGYIKSPLWFQVVVILREGDGGLQAGDYFFEKSTSVFGMGHRMSKGLYGITSIKVTVPEGLTVFQTGKLLREKLVNVDPVAFTSVAEEGYMFPDTYLFPANIDARSAAQIMRNNFNRRVAEISHKIESFGKPLEDVIIMASIIEEEARQTDTRRMISGILWRRLAIGMPLQVDAAFQYVNGKNTYTLTKDDLGSSSPYNTYTNAGLPPGPIANPGLDAIEAAVTPLETPYLYFLSDREGNMYYAVDFEQHKENRRKVGLTL